MFKQQGGPQKDIRRRQGRIKELQKPNEVRTNEERRRHRGETEQEGRKRVMTTNKGEEEIRKWEQRTSK